MGGFDLRTMDSQIWDLLSANHTLKELYLDFYLGRCNLDHLASAVKSNTGLRLVSLGDRTSDGGFTVFARVLTANTCLDELRLMSGLYELDRQGLEDSFISFSCHTKALTVDREWDAAAVSLASGNIARDTVAEPENFLRNEAGP